MVDNSIMDVKVLLFLFQNKIKMAMYFMVKLAKREKQCFGWLFECEKLSTIPPKYFTEFSLFWFKWWKQKNMKSIDEAKLEEDIVYRYEYLAEFIGFGEEDVFAIRSVIGNFAPLIPQIVEATYEKMLNYDATARHFVPRQHGYEGETPNSIEDLDLNNPQIKFRREHLQRYLMNLLGHSYDKKIATYLNIVGKMHTPQAGNKKLDVPLVQMNALMGALSDILIQTIAGFGLEAEQELKVQRAFQKLLWIQNDFISRHYSIKE